MVSRLRPATPPRAAGTICRVRLKARHSHRVRNLSVCGARSSAPPGCGDGARVAAHAHVPTSNRAYRPHVVAGRRPHVVAGRRPHKVVRPHVVLRPHVFSRVWFWLTLMYLLLTCRSRAYRGPGDAF
jgi:hypothetical protein